MVHGGWARVAGGRIRGVRLGFSILGLPPGTPSASSLCAPLLNPDHDVGNWHRLRFSPSSSSPPSSSPSTSQNDDAAAAVSRFQDYLGINTAHPHPDYAAVTHFLISQGESLSLPSQTLEFVPGKPLVVIKLEGPSPRYSCSHIPT
ncbi:hypothetical protein MLD38_013581 [Melastoma candidum]|uniref:Uncharacterized protein n=1 Tax=Melastoma candidum TaxID=119954 RepID=A0ACB9RDP7_9MYRT|nr:hypothetical protein MLD38_013581 [Melastoma candidum]